MFVGAECGAVVAVAFRRLGIRALRDGEGGTCSLLNAGTKWLVCRGDEFAAVKVEPGDFPFIWRV